MVTHYSFIASLIIPLALLISLGPLPSSPLTHPSDVLALRKFKALVAGSSIPPGSCLASWNFSSDPCDSAFGEAFTCGIQCRGPRVTAVMLDDAGYAGLISPSLADLTQLEQLNIGRNYFCGSVPGAIFNLPSLTSLDLSGNQLSGFEPVTLGALNLTRFDLSYNRLRGEFPIFTTKFTKLVTLLLNNNRLYGHLPVTELQYLAQLRRLDASHNLLTGKIPSHLPASLTQLSLRDNRLTGKLPDSLSQLPVLNVLDLSSNQLSGKIYRILFNPSLQQLNLAHNRFTELHVTNASVSAASQLVAMDLGNNSLAGPLPVYLAFMRQLISVSLNDNYFKGKIPLEYALKAISAFLGVQPFQRLYLEGNYLVGTLPSPFLTSLVANMFASFDDNCLRTCPVNISFCQGKGQKPFAMCGGKLGNIIP